jgi:hypothetical protein
MEGYMLRLRFLDLEGIWGGRFLYEVVSVAWEISGVLYSWEQTYPSFLLGSNKVSITIGTAKAKAAIVMYLHWLVYWHSGYRYHTP